MDKRETIKSLRNGNEATRGREGAVGERERERDEAGGHHSVHSTAMGYDMTNFLLEFLLNSKQDDNTYFLCFFLFFFLFLGKLYAQRGARPRDPETKSRMLY